MNLETLRRVLRSAPSELLAEAMRDAKEIVRLAQEDTRRESQRMCQVVAQRVAAQTKPQSRMHASV